VHNEDLFPLSTHRLKYKYCTGQNHVDVHVKWSPGYHLSSPKKLWISVQVGIVGAYFAGSGHDPHSV